jgi:hypothetical protein
MAAKLALASIVHDVTPWGKLTLSRETFRTQNSHRTRLLVVHGEDWALAAHVRGKRLPVAFWSGGVTTRIGGTFSKWNEPVHVHAPASSIPRDRPRLAHVGQARA